MSGDRVPHVVFWCPAADGSRVRRPFLCDRYFFVTVRPFRASEPRTSKAEVRAAGSYRQKSHPQNKAKAHVFTKPLNVVCAPGVVEEAEVNAFGHVGLRL